MSKREIQKLFIGQKALNDYTVALMRMFKTNKQIEVVARGKNIGNAVIISDLATRTLENVTIAKVDIGSEDVTFENPNSPTKDKITRTLTNIRILLEKSK